MDSIYYVKSEYIVGLIGPFPSESGARTQATRYGTPDKPAIIMECKVEPIKEYGWHRGVKSDEAPFAPEDKGDNE